MHEISTYGSSRGQHQKLPSFCYQKKSNKRGVKARTSHSNVNSLVQLKQVMKSKVIKELSLKVHSLGTLE